MLDGVILKGIGGFYYIDTVQGVYECRARGIFRKEGIRPVSYTHLDVYKRQDQPCHRRSNRFSDRL